jgi:hypothetical protein
MFMFAACTTLIALTLFFMSRKKIIPHNS